MELEQALKEIETLKSQLKQFDGIDLDQVGRDRKSLSDLVAAKDRELADLKALSAKQKAEGDQAIASVQAQITRRDIQGEFNKQFGVAKGLSEYQEVLFTTAIAGDNLKLENGVVTTTDGKPLSELLDVFRKSYPAMFAPENDHAGSGSTGSNTTTKSGVQTIKGSDLAAISSLNPEDVANGKVVIEV